MYFLLPHGGPGEVLVLPGSDSGLVNSDGSTGVHADLRRGSAWSDAGGKIVLTQRQGKGRAVFTPTRTNFTLEGLPPNTSCWPPNPFWRVIKLHDGRLFGVSNAGLVGKLPRYCRCPGCILPRVPAVSLRTGRPPGRNKAMVAVVSTDGVNFRYLSTVANGTHWASQPEAEGMGENSCALTPSGRIVVV